MLRKVAFMACMAGAVVFAMACSDDSGAKKIFKDQGGVTLDSGGGTKQDKGGTTKQDKGGTTKKDGGGTTVPKDCYDIIVCASKCSSGDQTCAQKCISAAPAAAQTKYNAYQTCAQAAIKGSCKASCTSSSDPKCMPCVNAACKKEKDACYGTGGAVTPGFGAVCDTTTKCLTGLTCLMMSSTATKGVCLKECTGSGKPCSGGPAGTAPYCIMGATGSTKMYCGFVCKASTQTWPCPTALKCGALDANKQAYCEPK